MKPLSHKSALTAMAALLLASCGGTAHYSISYPPAPRQEQVDVYHGTPVRDPYRWLEDTDSPETREWIQAQNELTLGYLESIPEREHIRERLEELWNHERFGVPVQRGRNVFYLENDGLQDQAVLHVTAGVRGEPQVLLDPNELSEDGTVALASFAPSPDGRLLAYGLSVSGSDWRVWRVRDVESGQDLTDEVTRNKFGGIEWARDSSGFFYSRFDVPAEGEEYQERNPPPDVCFHRLGTPEEADEVVLERPEEPEIGQGFSLTEDGSAMIVSRRNTRARTNELFWLPLESWSHKTGEEVVEAGWRASALEAFPLVTDLDARFSYITDDGGTIWVRTDWKAPRWRIVAIEQERPDPAEWREVVPAADEAIQSVEAVGKRLVVTYLKDAASCVRVFDRDGRSRGDVALPGIGTVRGFEGDPDSLATFFSFTSFTQPTSIYRWDVSSGKSEPYLTPTLPYDPEAYETIQVFYESVDGTRIPMFLTYRRGAVRDGTNPTLLYGYGGFNISQTPFFKVPHLVWMEMGGMFALANIRGGGEYGEDWHEAGTKVKKQNVFDDFIRAAEWLVGAGYTRPDKLAISGRSNGGLLVGACLTQRPDLFGAALPAVGVMDMLRYHHFTIGWAWAGDYGSAEEPEEFEALLAYSPVHNVRPGTSYPSTLVTTADHDDRVVPGHSFKFAAALQAAQAGTDPVLIRVETRAGHGHQTSTSALIEEAADKLAFLAAELGVGLEP